MKCKIQSWRKKDKMWSMIITVKKGELLMPDHKRADHPERSKLISTFCLGKMLFLSHSKKQVRFDFTTKILHVTQVFGEIHDSNAPVSRTFILYMVSLRLSFLFCCRISVHIRPISRDFKSDKHRLQRLRNNWMKP